MISDTYKEIDSITSCLEINATRRKSQYFTHVATVLFKINETTIIPVVGSGLSRDKEESLNKTLGEVIERYCSRFIPDNCPKFSYNSNNTGIPCVAPEEFCLFSDAELSTSNYKKFDKDTILLWVKCISLKNFTYKMIPTDFIFLNETSQAISQNVSTGLACHSCREQAILSSVLEVVERDAITITWYAQKSPEKICLDDLPKELLVMVQHIYFYGFKLNLMDVRTDNFIPVILATGRKCDINKNMFVVSSAANPNVFIAIKKALEELLQSIVSYKYLLNNSKLPINKQDIQEVDDHSLWYQKKENQSYLEFLDSSNLKISAAQIQAESPCSEINTLESNIMSITASINKTGHDVFIVDLTTTEFIEENLSVIKAIIPGYIPLTFGSNNICTNGKRLSFIKHINREPHPFP